MLTQAPERGAISATSKSDVWMFAVTVWEMYSFGATPYNELPLRVLLEAIRTGHRLSRPKACTKIVFDVLQSCWQVSVSERPHFSTISENISRVDEVRPANDFDVVQNRLLKIAQEEDTKPVAESSTKNIQADRNSSRKSIGPAPSESHDYQYASEPVNNDGS